MMVATDIMAMQLCHQWVSACLLHRLNTTCTPCCILLSLFVSAVLVHSYEKTCSKDHVPHMFKSMYLLYFISVASFFQISYIIINGTLLYQSKGYLYFNGNELQG